MEVLTKTAVTEIIILVDDESVALRLEICRSQREKEALKTKLLLLEGQLRAVRGYGEGAPDNDLNLPFEVEVCDEVRETQSLARAAGRGSVSTTESVSKRRSADPTRGDQSVPIEEENGTTEAFHMKCEPVDGEPDWSESLLLKENRLGEDPKSSQSQVEQKISEENTCGTSGAVAANDREGPLCKEEELHMQTCPAGDPEKRLQAELKQEPEEQPLTPLPPLLEPVDRGMELQCVWSEANSLGQHRGSLEHGDSWLADDFSPPHYRASQRPCTETEDGPASHLEPKQNGHPLRVADDILAEMVFPLCSQEECDERTLCEVNSDTSTEAKSPCRIEGLEVEFICAHCGKTFPEALELETHEKQHSLEKLFSYPRWGKDFTSSRILEKHKRVHSREGPFTRSGCDKSFSQSQVLQAHESTQTGQKPYVCADCGKHFRHQDRLKAHQRIHTREKPFTCDQCGKCFFWKSHLKIHQVTHTGEKCFSCTVCNKSFAYQHVLKRHQRLHNGDKCCSLCGKFFDSADSVKQHRRDDHGEKPHFCYKCGMSFLQLGNLKTHERVHTGEKPFTCDQCGKCFSLKCSLKAHQVTHTGEKCFSCTVCNKSFAYYSTLKRHQSFHTSEKPHCYNKHQKLC